MYQLGQLKLSPVPVNDYMTIEWEGPENNSKILFYIVDATGKTINEFEIRSSKGPNTYSLNVSKMRKASYFIWASVDGTVLKSRFVKQ